MYGEDEAILLDYIECALEHGVDYAQQDARWWTNEALSRGLHAGEARDSESVRSHIHPPGSNLEIIPWYLDLNDAEVLRKMPESVRRWWKENKHAHE